MTASPTSSTSGSPTKDVLSESTRLPKPKRLVEGWGAPEILIYDHWMAHQSEPEPNSGILPDRERVGTRTGRRYSTTTMGTVTPGEMAEATPTMPLGSRVPPPDFMAGNGEEDWLFDEELPSLTPELLKGLSGGCGSSWTVPLLEECHAF